MSFKKLLLIFSLFFVSFYAQANKEESDLFLYSIITNHFRVIQEMLEKDSSLIHRTYEGDITPLHYVQSFGIARLLLDYGADPTLQDTYGNTPLHLVVMLNDIKSIERIEIIELLLKADANLNIKNNDDATPLYYAQESETVEFLLKNGADPNIQDIDGNTPLHIAVRSGYLKPINKIDIIKTLLARGANPNSPDEFGNTPLHSIVLLEDIRLGDRIKIAELLLKAGADPNIQNNSKFTPLNFIVISKYLKNSDKIEIIKLLLKNGADPHIGAFSGVIPLDSAADFEIIDLLGTPADLDDELKRFLHSMTNDFKIAQKIIEKKPELAKYRYDDNTTPLHYIMIVPKIKSTDRIKIAELLLKAGADPNTQDERKWTPLNYVLASKHIKSADRVRIAEFLLKNNANPNAQYYPNKWTLLHFVMVAPDIKSTDKREIAKLLIKAGADPQIKNEDGQTPIDFTKDLKIINLLQETLGNTQNSIKKNIFQSLKNKCVQIFRFPKK